MQCVRRSFEAIGMTNGLERIRESIRPISGEMLLGLSGGADSVALFHILRETEGVKLTAVHVNHGLRGEESIQDEAFVRDLCRRYGIGLLSFQASPENDRSELWAREVRYAFFREAMERSGADWLVLAHHQNDQAETLIEHLLRGSGLDGLCCMARETEQNGLKIMRPLLNIASATLREALAEAGYSWREDGSNADLGYTRNRIRHQLLPLMEEIRPGAVAHIANSAIILRSEKNHLEEESDRFLAMYAGCDWIEVEPLLQTDQGMRNRILRNWWRGSFPNAVGEMTLNRKQTSELEALCSAPNKTVLNLPHNTRAFRGRFHLHLCDGRPPFSEPAVSWCEEGVCMKGIRLVPSEGLGNPGNGRISQEVPPELLHGTCVRTREEGDWLRPFGSTGRQSLQDYLVNRGVDEPWRDRIPLLCRGKEILLVCGVGAGAIPRWNPREFRVRLTWKGEIPWCTLWKRENAVSD